MNNRKAAIVTGGGQGIGKATVLKLLQAGYGVVAEIDEQAGEEVVSEYDALGDVCSISTDVADEASVQQTVAGWASRASVICLKIALS